VATPILYIEIEPMAFIPDAAGSGPALPIVIDIDTPGTYEPSEFNIPTDVPLTIELWGGGGGGAGSPVGASPGGGGGGGGSYAMLVVMISDLGPTPKFIVADVAAGGIANADGANGGDTVLTDDEGDKLAAGGGLKGVHTGGVGGAGGVVVAAEGIVPVVSKAGSAGTTTATAAGGKGGAGKGYGSGSGGAGGTGTSGAGGAGTAPGGGGGGGSATVGVGGQGAKGKMRVTFAVP
jgi:hypothetical protein